MKIEKLLNRQGLVETQLLPTVIALLSMRTFWLLTDLCLHKVISINRVFSNLYPEESGRHNRFDDDNLPFDVFLTYAEPDRHIMEQMYMDLTSGSRGRTFKCAVHDKDFVPGLSIGKCYKISILLWLIFRQL